MELRPYQTEFVDSILSEDGPVLGILATGGGKTACASEMMRRLKKCWFLVHRDELVGQTVATLRKFGLRAGAIKSGREADGEADIQVVGVQTMAARGATPPEDVAVIVDEAHTVSFYDYVRRIILTHKSKVIGLTATPWRTRKTEGMKDIYLSWHVGPTTSDLIEMGFLTRPVTYGFKAIDMTSYKKVNYGDYRREDLAVEAMCEESLATVVRETKRHVTEGTAIVFCVNVTHAKALAKRLPNAEYVIGETALEKRAEIFDRLRSGKTRFLCSVGVLTEGFDVTSIGAVILARPTLSRALHVQMIGRGLRIHPGKKVCKVLDFAGNTERHGFAHKYAESQMQPDEGGEPGDAPVKICKECYAIVPIFEEFCTVCGAEFEHNEKEKRAMQGALVVLEGEEAARLFKLMHGRLPPKGHPIYA
jgi:DNA repair protein RadD